MHSLNKMRIFATATEISVYLLPLSESMALISAQLPVLYHVYFIKGGPAIELGNL